jgi:hypothetical protein
MVQTAAATKLSKNLLDRLAVVDIDALAAGDVELTRVEAHLVKNGRVDVGDVVAVSTAWKPISSVAPWTTPALTPPPAMKTEKPKG